MNLSRLVSIAGFKKKSKQESFKENKQQSSQVAESMWDDCLVSSAPNIASFKKEQESHPLEKACTEAEYLESLVKTIEGKILPHIIEQHLESSIPQDLQEKAIIDEKRILELTNLVLQEDARTSVNYVKAIHTSGTSLEDI